MVLRAWHLDARITVYDKQAPPPAFFSPARPVPLWRSVAFMDEARANGTPVTFRAEGPDAQRAIAVVRAVMEAPPGEIEAEIPDVF